jgi:PKD repeat protein
MHQGVRGMGRKSPRDRKSFGTEGHWIRRPRSPLVLVVAVALSLMMALPAFANDEVDDINATGSSIINLGTQTVGTTVTGQSVELVLRYGSGQHAAVGEVVTVETRNPGAANSGVSSQTWSFTVPSGWGPGMTVSDTQLVDVYIQADGESELKVNCTSGCTRINANSATVLFQYTAQSAPTNAAPTNVSASFGGAVDCRVAATLTVTFTDPDSTSWSAVIDWDYDGSTFTNDESVASIASGDQFPHTYNAPGSYTAAVKVTDNQGATSAIATGSITVDQAYTVTFLSPFDGSTPALPLINRAKAGRVVPVKVTIYDDCALAPYESPAAAPSIRVSTATNTTGSTMDTLEVYADAGNANSNSEYFRWSPDGFWIYNLDTRTILSGSSLITGKSYRIDALVGTEKATDDEWGLLQTVK